MADFMHPFSGLAGIAGDVYSLFNRPGDKAFNYLNQILPMLHQMYDPFIQQGAVGRHYLAETGDQLQRYMKDPSAIMQGYQSSAQYDNLVNQATQAAQNIGATSGQLGTGGSQEQLAKHVMGLASMDQNAFMNRRMNVLHSLGAEGGALDKLGFGASASFAGAEQQNLQNQASQAYQDQLNRSKTWGNLFSDVGSQLDAGNPLNMLSSLGGKFGMSGGGKGGAGGGGGDAMGAIGGIMSLIEML